MDCEYCYHFQQAKWRVNPDPDDASKKVKKRLRYCQPLQEYIPGSREKCADHFSPNNIFWCNANNYWMDIDSCLARKKKGREENCLNCRQHNTIIELAKARAFLRRRQATEQAKPVLLRRRT